jgi:tetratricopeptide (TPR) repeat protein
LLLISTLLAYPLAAAEIEGEVRAGSVAGLERVAIVQLLDGEKIVKETYTGFDGRFDFSNVSVKAYRLRVHYSGFQPTEVAVVFPPDRDRVHVPVTLTSPDDSAAALERRISDERNVPKSAMREYEKGLERRKKNECAKAVPYLHKAISLYGRFGDAYLELGNCLRQLNRQDEAEAYLLRSILHSSKIHPVLALSNLYVAAQRFEASRRIIEEAIERHPTEGDLFFALSRTYFEQGQMSEAQAAAHEAHSRGHRLPDVHLLLARIYLETGNRPALATQLELFIAESPDGPAAQQARATLAELIPEQ